MPEFTARQISELRRVLRLNAVASRLAGSFATVADLDKKAGLADQNVFTGNVNEFEQIQANGNISTDAAVVIEEGTIDATLLTGVQSYQLPDASGTLLTDAPSDGKYYVRRNGAWVEIIP